ncbi:uncharacterized protein E6C27_scaffold270G002130 [Cucumis melo var. makuwa]|uniref:Reverse transcriptase n=1 Tax=Cucumis melo var. makuwa TaxID=1194695 RepID=A0A5A7TAF5_CUCMM|nr:uncharacterized protein E6C27_scaffold270G002130 [Cucumis melo var. makuwa]
MQQAFLRGTPCQTPIIPSKNRKDSAVDSPISVSSEEVDHGEKTDENEKLLQKEPFETDLNALFQLDENLKELSVVEKNLACNTTVQSSGIPNHLKSIVVGGVQHANKRLAFRRFLKKHNPEVVLIQESKNEEFDISFIKSLWSFEDIGWYFVESQGTSGGILTLWDMSNLMVVETLKILARLQMRGDFNITRWAHERFPCGRTTKCVRKFNNVIHRAKLFEVSLSNGRFTWSREDFVSVGCSTKNATVIECTLKNSHSVGWAGFVFSIKLRKVKVAVKEWFAVFQENQSRKEDDLISHSMRGCTG